tara:strand:- start:7 stop:1068 length:1062 start_codon:yes stop_codon:yes gene_type:complete
MAYIGRGTDSISNVEVLDNITFSGASSYTLQKGSANYVPISAANILVSIDGVVQANNFSVNGSTIDFGVAIANTSTCNFILHYGVGLVTTVQDGAITSTKLGSSSVTSAKMASNSIATASIIDDAITYAKMQDTSAANRVLGAASAGTVGEVQIATSMIADAQVDESKLKISNAPTNGYFLSAQSGGSGGMTWAEAGGGLEVADQWRLTTSLAVADAFLTANLEQVDTAPQGSLGSAMTQSSGVFTFPSTGFYWVKANAQIKHNANTRQCQFGIYGTANNSSYAALSLQHTYITIGASGNTTTSLVTDTLIDVTNVSTHKVKFYMAGTGGGEDLQGDSSVNATYFTFIKLGAT